MSKTPGSNKKGDEIIQRVTKEEVFRDRCRNLKRKTSELEDENNRLLKKLKKAKRIVARLRLERSFLFDKLEQYEAAGGAIIKDAERAQQKPAADKQSIKSSATKAKSSSKPESRNATPNTAGSSRARTQTKAKRAKPMPTTEEKGDNGSGAEDDVDLNKHLIRPAPSSIAKKNDDMEDKDMDEPLKDADQSHHQPEVKKED